MQRAMPRGASATSLAESEMSADAPDSHDEGDDDDDSEASEGDVAEWDPQPGNAPPLAPGVIKVAEGMLDADVKEVYSRLLADQVTAVKWPLGRSLAKLFCGHTSIATQDVKAMAYPTQSCQDHLKQCKCTSPKLDSLIVPPWVQHACEVKHT